MGNKLKVEVKGMDTWVRGTTAFGKLLDTRLQVKLLNALDATFDMTQELVHIITGSLRGSGRKEIEQTGAATFRVAVIYGGPAPGFPNDPVDYAIFEMARGGSHDFMTPAVVATEHEYPRAMADAVTEAFKAAFRAAA